MPYIKKEIKKAIKQFFNEDNFRVLDEGEVSYIITKLCNKFVKNKGISYLTLMKIIGILECTKLEFNRRLVAYYEELKRLQNGDVFLDVKREIDNQIEEENRNRRNQ